MNLRYASSCFRKGRNVVKPLISWRDVDEGYDTITLFGAAFIAIAGLVGGAIALNRMRGGDDLDDMFEDVIPGPMELQCPSCGGLISITTTQRPIQVGCPICASQFVLRE